MRDKDAARAGKPRDDRSAWEAIAAGPAVWEALGRAIKVERVARGWERKELAERAGLSYPYLSEIETGKKRPSWGALNAIGEALGLRPSQLLEAAETWPRDETEEVVADLMAPPSQRRSWFRETVKPMHARAVSPPMAPAGDDKRRAQIIRELLAYLESLPTEDLERLRGLARALRG